jgi:hypothetical protein
LIKGVEPQKKDSGEAWMNKAMQEESLG